MEDYAAYLAEEAKSEISALHQFRILYSPESEAYHFFFEGEEDSLFFMPEARRYIDFDKSNIYDCGGKKNVVEVRDLIKTNGYDIEKCLFFVDRDFDDLLGTQILLDNHTYMTDGYSIENSICSAESVEIILTEILKVSKANPEFNNIRNELKSGFNIFYKEVRPLIAWILASKNLGFKPNLSNTVGLKGVMTVSASKNVIEKSGFLEFKKKVVSNEKLPPFKETIKWRRNLDMQSAKKWVRGKYEIWFFYTALITSIGEANKRIKAAGGRTIRIPGALREGNIFEILGGRIKPPNSLEKFLENKLQTTK